MAPSLTSWWRLEARARDAELADALEARLADPLWLLARQWQTGEFEGADGGTPVNARARLSVRRVGWYRPGGPNSTAAPVALDTAGRPLDELVEAEARPTDLRLAIAGGRRWVRALGADEPTIAAWVAAGFSVAVAAGPLPDLDAERLGAATAGRALDGARIAHALAAASATGDFTTLPGDATANAAAAPAFLAWWAARTGAATTAPAWDGGRLEYAFTAATSTGDETVLAARQYAGGGIGWASVDVLPGATMRPSAGPAADTLVGVGLPVPVTFHGMPAARFWQFEDAVVSFPAIDAAADDLARLLAVEFALVYGNDFFVIPVRLPVGSLTTVGSLVVDDSFGVSTLIRSSEAVDGPGSAWHLFKLASDARVAAADPLDALFVPDAPVAELDGEPLEDVLLARDDMAAMAWAIEKVVAGGTGRPVDRALAAAIRAERAASAAAAAGSGQAAAPSGDLHYRLATDVPEYWYPLLPRQAGLRAVEFELGEVGLGPSPTPDPVGAILSDPSPLVITEEELYRAGLRIRRAARRLRWSDGSVHTWIGRRVGPGRGESGSGLRFDAASPG